MENKDPTPVELLKLFAEGAKIRMRSWSEGQYVQVIQNIICNQNGNVIPVHLSDVFDSKYVLYKAPKKLKRYWIWDIKTGGGCWYRKDDFLDEKGFTTNGSRTSLNWDHIEKRKAEPEQFIDVEVE